MPEQTIDVNVPVRITIKVEGAEIAPTSTQEAVCGTCERVFRRTRMPQKDRLKPEDLAVFNRMMRRISKCIWIAGGDISPARVEEMTVGELLATAIPNDVEIRVDLGLKTLERLAKEINGGGPHG